MKGEVFINSKWHSVNFLIDSGADILLIAFIDSTDQDNAQKSVKGIGRKQKISAKKIFNHILMLPQ